MNAATILTDQYVEALLFTSEQGLRIEEITYCLQSALLTDVTAENLTERLENIRLKYQSPTMVLELVRINNAYTFLTKKKYHQVITQLHLQQSKKKLSQAAMQTLAIVAYKQPVTKLDIEQIRGVNSEYSIQKLLDRELIVISGKANAPGRPVLYNTSPLFMDYFGINDIAELPQIKDLTNDAIAVGQPNE